MSLKEKEVEARDFGYKIMEIAQSEGIKPIVMGKSCQALALLFLKESGLTKEEFERSFKVALNEIYKETSI